MPSCAPEAPSHRTRPGRASGLLAALALMLAACEPTVDPTPYAGTPDALPRPAASQAFPRLVDVPDPPPDLPTPEERQSLRAQLEADRATARALAPQVDPNATAGSLDLRPPAVP